MHVFRKIRKKAEPYERYCYANTTQGINLKDTNLDTKMLSKVTADKLPESH